MFHFDFLSFVRVIFSCVFIFKPISYLLISSVNLLLCLFKRFSLLKTSGHVSYRFSIPRCVTFGKKEVRTQKTRNISKFDAQMGPGVSEAKKIEKKTFLKKQLCLGKIGPQKSKIAFPPPLPLLCFCFLTNYVEHS